VRRIRLALFALGGLVLLSACGSLERGSPPNRPPTAIGGDLSPLTPCDGESDVEGDD